MNHWEKVAAYIGLSVRVWGGRVVEITGPSVPGSAFCKAVDGGAGIHEVCTSFLCAANVVAQ